MTSAAIKKKFHLPLTRKIAACSLSRIRIFCTATRDNP